MRSGIVHYRQAAGCVMSAYLCDDCHLTALAGYALRHRLADRLALHDHPNVDLLTELGDLLKRENAKSLLARYGHQAGDTWPLDEPFRSCSHVMPDMIAPMAIIKAARCYAYQACEHDGWRDSGNLVRDLIGSIVNHAIGEMPQYRDATWGYDCDHSRKLISLAEMAKQAKRRSP
jgi:hypothetical protein